ncbi:MAG: type II secretion system protein [Sulfuricurvum sp.]|nr:type II secretion system protein [Sulfuricurvum sp.]
MKISLRRGFTFIELLFVIVILGIVGGIALEAIRLYYEGIYRTQTYAQRVNEADHILDQLSKYFENAIDMSIVNLDANDTDATLNADECAEPGVEAEASASDYTVAFLGVDVDSLHTGSRPGWSEQVQMDFTAPSLTSNDANFTAANVVITALYPASNLANSVIYNHQGLVGSCSHFNWDGVGGLKAYYPITGPAVGNTLPLTNPGGGDDKIQKYLIRTGYAFRVLNTGDFVMYSNFRPWKIPAEPYTGGKKSILGRDVASFYADFNNTNSYGDRGSIWRLKVCMRGLESNLSTSDIAASAICRERKVHVRY